jgi:molybdate transport system regulatory protein
MNRLRGHIRAIETHGGITLADVEAGGHLFSAIMLETPASAPYLAVDKDVWVLFKETEVSLAKNLSGEISLRNRIPAKVLRITRGAILSEVALESSGLPLASIITTRAVERLLLKEGDEVTALVKANEVSISGAGDEL